MASSAFIGVFLSQDTIKYLNTFVISESLKLKGTHHLKCSHYLTDFALHVDFCLDIIFQLFSQNVNLFFFKYAMKKNLGG